MSDLSDFDMYWQELDKDIDIESFEEDLEIEEPLYETSMESLGLTWRDFF